MSTNEEKSKIDERTAIGLLIIKGLKELFKLGTKVSGGLSLVTLIPDILKEYENYKAGQRELDERHQILNLVLQSIEQIKRGALSDIYYYHYPVPTDYTEYMKEYIRKNPFGASQHIEDLKEAIKALHDMRLSGEYTKKELDKIMGEWLPQIEKWQKQFLQAWEQVQQEKNSKNKNVPVNKSYDISTSDFLSRIMQLSFDNGFVDYESYRDESLISPGLLNNTDIFSYYNDIMSLYDIPELSSGILEGSAGQTVGSGFSLFPESVGLLDSLFGTGEGINIPVQYEIEVTGLEQFENLREEAEETGEAFEESRGTINNFSAEMMRQFLKLNEEKRAALSVDMAMLPLNIMGIGGAPFQFSMPVEESKEFSETLSDIAGIAGQLGGAFMKVDESIGKAIGSAGGFAGGISNVLSALKMNPLEGVDTSKMTPEQIESAREQGEKQKGLALMGGIQGAFAGLQGLFGGAPGSF